jgi:hypothetical protein
MKSASGVSVKRAAWAALALVALLATTPSLAGAQFRGGHSTGGRGFVGGGARSYGGGARYYGGGTRYYGGGTRYYGGGAGYHGRPYYYHPRSVVRLGIGFGFYGPYYDPWYYPVPYPVYEPAPVVHEVVITDAPPAGCYYYDPYCERRFSSLDAYLDHLDSSDHDAIIEVIDRRSGDRIHTYEYSHRDWRVRDDARDDRQDRDRQDRDRQDRDRDDDRDGD